jgi:hypothetical protein
VQREAADKLVADQSVNKASDTASKQERDEVHHCPAMPFDLYILYLHVGLRLAALSTLQQLQWPTWVGLPFFPGGVAVTQTRQACRPANLQALTSLPELAAHGCAVSAPAGLLLAACKRVTLTSRAVEA